jgi:hypothetical protein
MNDEHKQPVWLWTVRSTAYLVRVHGGGGDGELGGRRAARAPCGLRTRGQPHTAGYISREPHRSEWLLGFFAPDPSRARARVGLRMPTRLRRGGWVGFYGPRLIHTLPGEPRPPEKKKQLVLLPEVVGVK